ncbi:MAG TPA: CYTH domain-containing protein [Candidatus Eisenbacteria bacterium]|nr:CYTH domain-containing protein [Candidatus Eisenbacteria bacterium]
MERELKFFYKDNFSQMDIIIHPIIENHLLSGDSMSYAMRSSYFDTSDELLRKRKAVLRIRRANEHFYLTFKMPIHEIKDKTDGVFERQEFEFKLSEKEEYWDSNKGISPAWFLNRMSEKADYVDQDLKQLLLLLEDRPLNEVCLADYTRNTYAYEYKLSRFELSFDEGYLGNSEHVEQFSELEFELLSGSMDDLLSLRTVLLEELPIIAAKISKYEQAIAIADQFK